MNRKKASTKPAVDARGINQPGTINHIAAIELKWDKLLKKLDSMLVTANDLQKLRQNHQQNFNSYLEPQHKNSQGSQNRQLPPKEDQGTQKLLYPAQPRGSDVKDDL